MASPHPPLLSADDARRYCRRRANTVEQLNGLTIEQLVAQMTWWLIHEAFDRHPELGGFRVSDGTDPNDDEGSWNLHQLQVKACGTDPEATSLAEMEKHIRDTLIGYGMVCPDGLHALLETQGVDRAGLNDWDWGLFGQAWIPQREQKKMDQDFPPPSRHKARSRL